MLNSYAAFDSLYIGMYLEAALRNVAEGEIHLFAYLGCLLSLYRKRPTSDWGYSFSGTRNGTPFSVELNDSIAALKSAGLFRSDREYLNLTEPGKTECDNLSRLSLNHERTAYLDGACGCLLTMPVGVVKDALFQEPMLRPVLLFNDARALLEGPGLTLIYDQFAQLSEAIGVEVKDLLIPATVWLTYLSRSVRDLAATSQVRQANA
jgi:hypothetical protein